jgi:translation initiation factor IF-2
MAKIRAYKLAEELKLEREELIAKAAELGIDVRSPMSALDDDVADQLRSRLGASARVVTQESRVGGTVIRRRRKVEETAAPAEEPAAPAPDELVQPELLEAEPLAVVPPPAPPVEVAPEPSAPLVAEPAVVAPVVEPAPALPKRVPPTAPVVPGITRAQPGSGLPARMTTPVKVVEDPLAGQMQAGQRPAAAAARPAEAAPAAGAGFASPPGFGGERDDRRAGPRRVQRRQEVLQGQTLKEQETMARMMRGNVQAHLEKRRMLVEQQARMTPRRKKSGRKAPLMVGERHKLLRLGTSIAVTDLSTELGVKVRDLARRARELDVEIERDAMLDAETATLLAGEFGFEVVRVETETDRALAMVEGRERPEAEGDPRPPIVTVMGHVDHGKTSLLDALRQTRVAEGEAGGITQHVGAYQVSTGSQLITFIDTPGHAAFTQMRARGAQVTDIVVLVVAADDGVMPQTVEAINHARAAKVPIIVAINKCDKADANPARVKQALLEHQLVVEDFGGDVLSVELSATKRTNLDKLLEAISLQSEVLELRAASKGEARATVIEASLDKGRGPIATVLVRQGLLQRGDSVVAGSVYGRIRTLLDDTGKQLKEAGPSTPVQILGLAGVPDAGDELVVMKNEREAKRVADHRIEQRKREAVAEPTAAAALTAEQLFAQMGSAGEYELNVVLKADVRGSAEATRDALEKLSTERVKLKVLHAAVGAITESDITLATASRAVVLGFHVRPEPAARKLAERESIDVRTFDIVYELLDDARGLMEGLLPKRRTEKVVGHALVKQLFQVPRIGTVAGCEMREGAVRRSNRVRVVRDGVQVYDGKLSSLRRFKDDVREVSAPLECGMGVENYNDVKVGDMIEAYEVEETADKL